MSGAKLCGAVWGAPGSRILPCYLLIPELFCGIHPFDFFPHDFNKIFSGNKEKERLCVIHSGKRNNENFELSVRKTQGEREVVLRTLDFQLRPDGYRARTWVPRRLQQPPTA